MIWNRRKRKIAALSAKLDVTAEVVEVDRGEWCFEVDGEQFAYDLFGGEWRPWSLYRRCEPARWRPAAERALLERLLDLEWRANQ